MPKTESTSSLAAAQSCNIYWGKVTGDRNL